MKKIFMLIVVSIFLASTAQAAVTLRYHNSDSSNRTFAVKSCGSAKKITFDGSKTASATIQGCSSATIYTSCGNIEVKDGDKVEIKDGCVTVK